MRFRRIERGNLTKDQVEDIAFLSYLTPFFAGIIGWIYYYIILGPGESFYTIFVVVSKDPFLYLIGCIGVITATIFDAKGSEGHVEEIASRVEKVALALLAIEATVAFLIAGVDISKIFYMFVDGKYSVILPLSLLIYSYLIPVGRTRLPRPSLHSTLNAFAILIMISAPAFIFYMYALHGATGAYEEGVCIFLIGFALFIISNQPSLLKKTRRKT